MKLMIGKYEATIYPERGGYTGALSCGFGAAGRRIRVKRKGRTKAQVKERLREVVDDMEAGITARQDYIVRQAVEDFLNKGLKGKSQQTISNYRSLAAKNLIPQIGDVKLKELTADRLDTWIDERAKVL